MTLKQELERVYIEALNKVEDTPKRWNIYNNLSLSSLHWRLWDSVEFLDITLVYLKDLLAKSKRRKQRPYFSELTQLIDLVSDGLAYLDPDWRRTRRFRDLTKNREDLRNAKEFLEQAEKVFQRIYLGVSLKIEAPRRGSWGMTTPAIVKSLRDSTYALKQYLAGRETTNGA